VIFQTLDDKKECVGIYYNNNLNFNSDLPEDISATWSYSAFLKNKNINYANIFCHGKNIEDICPEHLKNEWTDINNLLKAHLSAIIETKINVKKIVFLIWYLKNI